MRAKGEQRLSTQVGEGPFLSCSLLTTGTESLNSRTTSPRPLAQAWPCSLGPFLQGPKRHSTIPKAPHAHSGLSAPQASVEEAGGTVTPFPAKKAGHNCLRSWGFGWDWPGGYPGALIPSYWVGRVPPAPSSRKAEKVPSAPGAFRGKVSKDGSCALELCSAPCPPLTRGK